MTQLEMDWPLTELLGFNYERFPEARVPTAWLVLL